MKVDLSNGKQYVVKFRYGSPDKYFGNWFRGTDCLIYDGEIEVSVGHAVAAPEDNFSKRIGRKIAFTRALNNLFPADRKARSEFWNKYLETVRL